MGVNAWHGLTHEGIPMGGITVYDHSSQPAKKRSRGVRGCCLAPPGVAPGSLSLSVD